MMIKNFSLSRLCFRAVYSLILAGILFSSPVYAKDSNPPAKPHALIYTKNGEGFVHDNIASSITGLKKLLDEKGVTYDVSEDPSLFTDSNLKKYDVLIFSSTNNETFDTDKQRKAFQKYIQNGGGFVGIHSASGSERNWPWFWAMLGGKFFRHPPFQSFNIVKIDPDHPSAKAVPQYWEREDECYYIKELNPDIRIVLAADLTSINDDQKDEYPGNIFGKYFPVTWYHHFDGGHQWYTSLGHAQKHYEDPVFMEHIWGGISWVLEARAADTSNH